MFKVTDLVSLKPPTGSGDRMQTVGYENTDSDMILPLVAHNRFENKHVAGLQIRERTRFFFLFLNQNICCGYSKEPSR